MQARIRQAITLDGAEEFTAADLVSGEYSALGLAPAAGRLLGPADDAAPSPVAVIGYDYWRRRFALNPAAIGKSVAIGAATLTIVGVEPRGFSGALPGWTRDFIAPLSMSEGISGGKRDWRQAWDNNFLSMMARLKPGSSVARANAEVSASYDAWRHDKAPGIKGANYPESIPERARQRIAGRGGNKRPADALFRTPYSADVHRGAGTAVGLRQSFGTPAGQGVFAAARDIHPARSARAADAWRVSSSRKACCWRVSALSWAWRWRSGSAARWLQ